MTFQSMIRARNNEVLSQEQLRRYAPSLFAEEAHESRSHRYAYIPSKDVMQGLMSAGFMPVEARQSRPRDEDRRAHTKHMVRFRKMDAVMRAVGDTLPEVVLVNAHDGTSSYNLMAGLLRLACLNGMVVSAGEIANIRVQHSGSREKIVREVIEGAYTVLEESTKALEAPREWSKITLGVEERVALADSAHMLRFADADGVVDTPIKSTQLLVPRRTVDTQRDLWTTFNVIQENVIRGGLQAHRRDPANGRMRRVSTREVNGIDQNVRLNKALWALGERMAQLKQAA